MALLLPQQPREQRLHEAPENSGEAGLREGVGPWKLWLWLALTSCCQEQGVVEVARGQPLPLWVQKAEPKNRSCALLCHYNALWDSLTLGSEDWADTLCRRHGGQTYQDPGAEREVYKGWVLLRARNPYPKLS